jgi:hypothetical protein
MYYPSLGEKYYPVSAQTAIAILAIIANEPPYVPKLGRLQWAHRALGLVKKD